MKKNIFNFLKLTFLTGLILQSCATRLPAPEGVPDISQKDYDEVIENNTYNTQIYEGLYNKVSFDITLLTPEVIETQVAYEAKLLQKPQDKYKEELLNRKSQLTQNTEVFLSFFTPEKKQDDLNSSTTSWQAQIEIDGKVYKGEIKKIKKPLHDLQATYPHFNRWMTPYLVKFNVPYHSVMNSKAYFILTGPIATSKILMQKTK